MTMTSPDEPQTPPGSLEWYKEKHAKSVRFAFNLGERNEQLDRELELVRAQLLGSRRIIDEMGVELRKAQALLASAQEDLIWCGGSEDFGPRGQAKVGYDKGPRATIAAIAEALKP